jgi:hypothetical protein
MMRAGMLVDLPPAPAHQACGAATEKDSPAATAVVALTAEAMPKAVVVLSVSICWILLHPLQLLPPPLLLLLPLLPLLPLLLLLLLPVQLPPPGSEAEAATAPTV